MPLAFERHISCYKTLTYNATHTDPSTSTNANETSWFSSNHRLLLILLSQNIAYCNNIAYSGKQNFDLMNPDHSQRTCDSLRQK
jgi:hypothetical protein